MTHYGVDRNVERVEWFSGSPLFLLCSIYGGQDFGIFPCQPRVDGQLLYEARMADCVSDRVC